MGAIFYFVVHTYTDKNNPCFHDERTYIPNLVLSPVQVPIELPQTVSPIRVQQMGVRTNFVQEEPLHLPCVPMIWAIYVVEDESIHLDILTLEL